jgi:hypothetical protein
LPSDEDLKAVRALEREVESALAVDGAGELDGDEFGAGLVTIYLYGHDADRMLASVEGIVRRFPSTSRSAYLRYGDVDDDTAAEKRLHL